MLGAPSGGNIIVLVMSLYGTNLNNEGGTA
jgi:hypothetical protein